MFSYNIISLLMKNVPGSFTLEISHYGEMWEVVKCYQSRPSLAFTNLVQSDRWPILYIHFWQIYAQHFFVLNCGAWSYVFKLEVLGDTQYIYKTCFTNSKCDQKCELLVLISVSLLEIDVVHWSALATLSISRMVYKLWSETGLLFLQHGLSHSRSQNEEQIK